MAALLLWSSAAWLLGFLVTLSLGSSHFLSSLYFLTFSCLADNHSRPLLAPCSLSRLGPDFWITILRLSVRLPVPLFIPFASLCVHFCHSTVSLLSFFFMSAYPIGFTGFTELIWLYGFQMPQVSVYRLLPPRAQYLFPSVHFDKLSSIRYIHTLWTTPQVLTTIPVASTQLPMDSDQIRESSPHFFVY